MVQVMIQKLWVSLSSPRLNIITLRNMGVMICLGQGGLRSPSASSFIVLHYKQPLIRKMISSVCHPHFATHFMCSKCKSECPLQFYKGVIRTYFVKLSLIMHNSWNFLANEVACIITCFCSSLSLEL